MKVFFLSVLILLSFLSASINVLAEEVCQKAPDGSNSCGEGTGTGTVGDLGLGLGGGSTGTDSNSGGGGGGSTTPLAPGTQRMDVFIVKPRVDVAALSGPGQGFFGWLWQAITNFFSPPEEVDFLCGDIGVGVPSTADLDTRREAVNAVIQARFQGLGGQGRPFAERFIVFFADGGLEAYVFSGAASSVAAVPGTLQVGSSIISKCKV